MNFPAETADPAFATANAAASPRWHEPTFVAGLGDKFSLPQLPQALPDPHWVARSDALANTLGVAAWMRSDDALTLLAGNALPSGVPPRATVYSGHQFGVWAGQLGDGRALLLGEWANPQGHLLEVQIKGGGLTPFSRMGDGRAVLRSSIREFLCSEAMHALGIPTTRALAVAGSPQPVRRETIETAAVVTRVAPSFIRFGHFEHFTHTASDVDALRQLTNAVIDRYYPAARDTRNPVAAMLEEVTRRTAAMVAAWQAVGFCHGVMNTDNMSILGLTIDYGPFGFLDAFDPAHICNHSDHQGRYAYARQPNVAFWNLHALAQALLPLFAEQDEALAALEPYRQVFPERLNANMRAKLGLLGAHEEDTALVDDFMRLLATDRVDFTIAFRRLASFSTGAGAANGPVRDLFIDRIAFDAWANRYQQRLANEQSADNERAARMNRVNPKFVLRNHLAQAAIEAAQRGDFAPTQTLLKVLESPFDEQSEHEAYAGFPPDWAQHVEVSCSS